MPPSTFAAASAVELCDLQNAAELNGLVGICTDGPDEQGRLPVEVYVDTKTHGQPMVKGIRVKLANVRPPTAAQGAPNVAESTLRTLHSAVVRAGGSASPEAQSAKLRAAEASFDFVVSTMQAHASDFAVVDVALRLANLCTAALPDDSALQRSIFRKCVLSGLCQAAAAAMRQFASAEESEIQHGALRLFLALVGGVDVAGSDERRSLAEVVRTAAKDLDLLGLVRGALETHEDAEHGDADVVQAGLAVLEQWTRPGGGGGEAALDELLHAGLAPLIVRVLRAHGAREPTVAATGIQCISHMMDLWMSPPLPAARRGREALCAAGAHEVLMTLGHAYPDGRIAGGPSAQDLEAVTAKLEEMLCDDDDD